jgi:hypothetical protein
MKLSRSLVFLLPLFLAACAPGPQERADYDAVERSGVSPAIYDKMLHGDDLSIHDIEVLSRARVNSGIILRYIRDHGTVYYLNSTDIKEMQSAGVDASIVDYMLQTARGGWWGQGPYPYYSGWGYGPWWYGPYGGPGFYGPGFYGGGIFIGGRGGWHGGGGYHGHH